MGLSLPSLGIELFEEDERGNINQRNIGAFKSNILLKQSAANIRIEKQVRSLANYHRIELKTPAELVYRETGPSRIEMEGTVATLRAIRTDIKAGTLVIDTNGLQHDGTPTLRVFGNRLDSVTVSSAADVQLFDIRVNRFELQVRGAADIRVAGKSRVCIIDSQGAGDLDQSNLACENVTLKAFGASDILLHASAALEGRVQGAGDVTVTGNPAQRQLEIMGAYDVVYR